MKDISLIMKKIYNIIKKIYILKISKINLKMRTLKDPLKVIRWDLSNN